MNIPSEGMSSFSESGADVGPFLWRSRKRSRDARSRSPSSEDTTLADSIATDFLCRAQRPMITTRHPERMETNWVFWKTNAVRTTDFCKKVSSCKSSFLLEHLPRRAVGKFLGQGRLVRPKDGRKLRGRSLAHRGNCGLLTVKHVCANKSEFFFLLRARSVRLGGKCVSFSVGFFPRSILLLSAR